MTGVVLRKLRVTRSKKKSWAQILVNYDNIEESKINIPPQPAAQVDKFEKLERTINEEYLVKKTGFDINTEKTQGSVSNIVGSVIKMSNLADSFDERIRQLSK